jgi:hypothetical protein
VLASSVTTKRIFIYEAEFERMRSLYATPNCYARNWEHDYKPMGAMLATFPWKSPWVFMARDGNPWDKDALMYTWYCVDCRQTIGATKKRPDFWPNNHE